MKDVWSDGRGDKIAEEREEWRGRERKGTDGTGRGKKRRGRDKCSVRKGKGIGRNGTGRGKKITGRDKCSVRKGKWEGKERDGMGTGQDGMGRKVKGREE